MLNINTHFGFRKSLGTTDVHLLLTNDLQFSLDKPAKSKVVSLGFSSDFYSINKQSLLYKFKLISVGGSVFNIVKGFDKKTIT